MTVVLQAMMGCLVHVALGSWRAMADDLDAMGFLKEKIDKDELATALEEEVSKVWPLAGSFGANSFLPDGSAQTGGALADRLADGRVRPELGLGQGLTFGRLAKVLHIYADLPFAQCSPCTLCCSSCLASWLMDSLKEPMTYNVAILC